MHTAQSCDDVDDDADDGEDDGGGNDGGGNLLRIRYVMNEEMTTACATYAQWLDDSTQVSAKDLVIYLPSVIAFLSLCLPCMTCITSFWTASTDFCLYRFF